MGGKIECYIDLASFYSYLVFLELQRNHHLLESHSVTVEFHPFLLGAVNAGSGNKPPWTLPAKAAYGTHDGRRAVERFPNLEIQFPEDIMAVSLTVVPLRALHFIKRNHSTTAFETALHYFFHSFWSPPNVNLTRPENVAKALSEIPIGFKGSSGRASPDGKKLFSAEEVKAIMAGASSQDMKDVLKQTTQTALDRGAFGAPWLWVTNSAGEAEPFFGSDRFHFIYKFLALPFTDVTLLPPAGEKSRL